MTRRVRRFAARVIGVRPRDLVLGDHPGDTAPRGQQGVTAPRVQQGFTAPSGQQGVIAPSGQQGVTPPSGQHGVTAPSEKHGDIASERQQPEGLGLDRRTVKSLPEEQPHHLVQAGEKFRHRIESPGVPADSPLPCLCGAPKSCNAGSDTFPAASSSPVPSGRDCGGGVESSSRVTKLPAFWYSKLHIERRIPRTVHHILAQARGTKQNDPGMDDAFAFELALSREAADFVGHCPEAIHELFDRNNRRPTPGELTHCVADAISLSLHALADAIEKKLAETTQAPAIEKKLAETTQAPDWDDEVLWQADAFPRVGCV